MFDIVSITESWSLISDRNFFLIKIDNAECSLIKLGSFDFETFNLTLLCCV